MIDHLGGGQRFVDLLSLARKIDQELHAVGLDVAVFAHEANYLFVSFARAFRIHPQFPDDSCDRVAAVFARRKFEAATSLKFTRESREVASWILLFNRV